MQMEDIIISLKITHCGGSLAMVGTQINVAVDFGSTATRFAHTGSPRFTNQVAKNTFKYKKEIFAEINSVPRVCQRCL